MGKLEKLEQEIKAEFSKLKLSNELLIKTETSVTKSIRSKYLEMLEDVATVLHPPIHFLGDTDGNKEYVRLRNIVLSVFALLEHKINHLIIIKLDRNYATIPKPEDGVSQALNILLDEKNYSTKVNVIDTLYGKKKVNIGFLLDAGRIRNAFAHALQISDPKYLIKKRNIAQDIHAFDDFVEGAIKVKDELEGLIQEQPEVSEFNKRIQSIVFTLNAIQEANKKVKA